MQKSIKNTLTATAATSLMLVNMPAHILTALPSEIPIINKNIPLSQNNYFKNRQSVYGQLKFVKDIEPSIFENATPRIHLELLLFISGPEQFKAAAVFRGAGKSTLLNKVLILNRVFFEYEPFTMIVSSDKEKAQSFLKDIKSLIEKAKSKGYAIDKGDVWTQSRVEVIVNKGLKDKNGKSLERRSFIAAFGAGQDPRGYTYENVRPTLIIVDDLESKIGQYSIYNRKNRQKLKEWFYADLMPCLHPTRGQFIIIGTILHEDSILNNIICEKEQEKIKTKNEEDEESDFETHISDWHVKVIPIVNNGKSAWNSRFALQKIEKLKKRLERNGMANEFYQEYMCKAMSPDKQLFKKEYFKYFTGFKYSPDVEKFEVKDAISTKTFDIAKPTHINTQNGEIELATCRIYTTMDLASFDGADRTAIITFAITPKGDVYNLDISAGHWTPFEKAAHATRVQITFNPERFGIEKASAQNDFFYTIDVMQKETGVRIPVEPLSHHSKAKNIRISNMHGLFATGRIYFNGISSMTSEIEAELLAFDPEVESKHDDLMDAMAYIMEFIAGRSFDIEDEESKDE